MVVLFQPFECIPRVVIVQHSLNIAWIIMEVPESSAYVIGLNIMQVDVISYRCSEEGKELPDVF